MVDPPKGAFYLLCDRNIHVHTQSIQLIFLPGVGKYKLRKAGPPRLSTFYQLWNGRQEPSHELSYTDQVVGASEKRLLLNKVCVTYKVCDTIGVGGVGGRRRKFCKSIFAR